MIATATPVTAVITHGVRKVGWTLARTGGSSPSRAIANATRVWPSIRIITTTMRPMQAPIAISRPIQSIPTDSNAVASGAVALAPISV
jgi:hypothetical protein